MRQYIAIDLKSFYASVECVERGLDPLDTNLVVADSERTNKTICLAVSPSLKSYGISGRPRLFECEQQVRSANYKRMIALRNKELRGKAVLKSVIDSNPDLEIDYIVAKPRMAFYIEYSTRIYGIYLRYIAPEDIHVYSIDEVFIDVTAYLNTYKMTAEELAQKIINDVLEQTGITATAGIGTNLYLAKVAMDIVAKHKEPDENGVRIASLDEINYRKELWNHRPLTDFWRIGPGIARKLEAIGIFTVGDIAAISVNNSAMFYKMFGKNTELLIDHSWGYEPCTIADIKAYKPQRNSLGSGQVLHRPYNNKEALLITREMTDMLVLDLVEKKLLTNQIVLTVGYGIENLSDSKTADNYQGEIKIDHYGRRIPKHAHGTIHLDDYCSSTEIILKKVDELYERIINKDFLIRRINITFCNVIYESNYKPKAKIQQLDLFNESVELEKNDEKLKEERKLQEAILKIKKKYGKNSVLKGMNLSEGATARERNEQIGGHKK